MIAMRYLFTFCLYASTLLFFSCKKETKVTNVSIEEAGKNRNTDEGNSIPSYTEVPTLVLDNYVNRIFIDLVGREPSDDELRNYVDYLKAEDLSRASRDSLIRYVQRDTTDRVLGRYKEAYCTWLYEKAKGRFYVELGKDQDFRKAINKLINDNGGDTADAEFPGEAIAEILKLQSVLDSRDRFCRGEIGINDMMMYMIFNANYDEINMQNVNYVRACFNDLQYRIIDTEQLNRYAQALNLQETEYVYGMPFQNKGEFAYNMTHAWQFYDGFARWTYLTFMQREPNPDEVAQVIELLSQDSRIDFFQQLQRILMVTDEYARFRYVRS